MRNVAIELPVRGWALHHYECSLLPPSPPLPLQTNKKHHYYENSSLPLYRPSTILLQKPLRLGFNRLDTEMSLSLLMPQIPPKGHRSSGMRVSESNWQPLPTAPTMPEKTALGVNNAFDAHVSCRPSPKRERHKKVNLK